MKHRKKKKQKLGWLNLIWSSDFWVRWKNGSVCPRRHHSMENDWISRSNLGQSLGDQETTKISPTEEWLLRDIHVNIHLLWSSWPFTSSPCSFQVTEKKNLTFSQPSNAAKKSMWFVDTWNLGINSLSPPLMGILQDFSTPTLWFEEFKTSLCQKEHHGSGCSVNHPRPSKRWHLWQRWPWGEVGGWSSQFPTQSEKNMRNVTLDPFTRFFGWK